MLTSLIEIPGTQCAQCVPTGTPDHPECFRGGLNYSYPTIFSWDTLLRPLGGVYPPVPAGEKGKPALVALMSRRDFGSAVFAGDRILAPAGRDHLRFFAGRADPFQMQGRAERGLYYFMHSFK